MAKLLLSTAANDDLVSIHEYIKRDLNSPKAANNTVNKILNSLIILIEFPLSGTSLEKIVDFSNDYRFVVSGNYLSFYRVIDDTVYIDRILYGCCDYINILFK